MLKFVIIFRGCWQGLICVTCKANQGVPNHPIRFCIHHVHVRRSCMRNSNPDQHIQNPQQRTYALALLSASCSPLHCQKLHSAALYALLVTAASGSPLTCDVLSVFMRLVTPLPHAADEAAPTAGGAEIVIIPWLQAVLASAAAARREGSEKCIAIDV